MTADELFRRMCDAWVKLAREAREPRPWLRYMGSDEYAVWCVCLFLQWCNEP